MPSPVTLDGGGELRRALAALPEQIRAGARQAVTDAAKEVADDARRLVRVDTGALRDGIERRVGKGGLTAEVGVYKPELYYGQFHEFGTSSIPEQPFLTPAAETQRRRFPELVAEVVRKVVRR